MFELGKKEGAESGQDSTTTDRQESRSAATTATSSSGSAPRETAVIGRSIRINGDLQGEEDLRIEGDVNGTVRLHNNTLTIGQEGKIRADVYAKSVVVDGVMEGDVYSSERVAIRKSATVLGNITAPRVALDDGARFKGSIEMDPDAVEKALGKTDTDTRASADTPKQKSKANGSKPPAKPTVVEDVTAANQSVG
ncbi:MAG: bactofilin family protein [Gammaproteobacteria bacterium]